MRWKNLCKELAVAVRCKWRECNEAGEIKKERIGKRNELTGIMNHRANKQCRHWMVLPVEGYSTGKDEYGA